jgi:D-sedoheptulose 7-phosphate isomerase
MNTVNSELDSAVERITGAFRKGGKLLVCGNGGSSADSAHIVGEFVKGFCKKRPLPEEWSAALEGAPLQMGLPAIDLTAQGAVISAVVNDLGGECIFAQQVMAYGNPGDILLGISTSGNAADVALAMRVARLKGLFCIGLTGTGGGCLATLADLLIAAPETDTAKIQEQHIRYYHELCARVEAALFAE